MLITLLVLPYKSTLKKFHSIWVIIRISYPNNIQKFEIDFTFKHLSEVNLPHEIKMWKYICSKYINWLKVQQLRSKHFSNSKAFYLFQKCGHQLHCWMIFFSMTISHLHKLFYIMQQQWWNESIISAKLALITCGCYL